MREAGDVCFADVYKDGTGVCEYVRYEDMKYALKKLDDTKFKSHEVKKIFSKSREIRAVVILLNRGKFFFQNFVKLQCCKFRAVVILVNRVLHY